MPQSTGSLHETVRISSLKITKKKSQFDVSAKSGSGEEIEINVDAVRDAAVSLRPPSPSASDPAGTEEVHVALSNRARAAGGRGAAARLRVWGCAGRGSDPHGAVLRRRALDTDGGVLTARAAPTLTLVDGLEGTREVAVLAITVHLTPQRRNRHPAAAAARHLGGDGGRSEATSAPEENLEVGRAEEEVSGC